MFPPPTISTPLSLHDALPISLRPCLLRTELTWPSQIITARAWAIPRRRSEEHTSELQSRFDLVCRLLLEKKKTTNQLQTKPRQTNPSHHPHRHTMPPTPHRPI